ncbi:hypothetical protein B0H14DRAFT_3897865, partial [Mycena olivaceomarginata]
MIVIFMETVEKLKKNREDLKELCGSIVEIMRIVRDQNSSQGDTAAIKLQGLCGELERSLQEI